MFNSYLKIGDEFVAVSQATPPLPDHDYIEGAIEMIVEGVPLLTLRLWDLVDQLWEYLFEGVRLVCDGDSFEGTFPDQPAIIRMKPTSDGFMLFTVHNSRAHVCLAEFVPVFVESYFVFLKAMNRLHVAFADELIDELLQFAGEHEIDLDGTAL